MEVSGQLQAPVALLSERGGPDLIWRLEEKKLLPLPEFDSDVSVVQPVASLLYGPRAHQRGGGAAGFQPSTQIEI
jgi:hypothetical protein